MARWSQISSFSLLGITLEYAIYNLVSLQADYSRQIRFRPQRKPSRHSSIHPKILARVRNPQLLRVRRQFGTASRASCPSRVCQPRPCHLHLCNQSRDTKREKEIVIPRLTRDPSDGTCMKPGSRGLTFKFWRTKTQSLGVPSVPSFDLGRVKFPQLVLANEVQSCVSWNGRTREGRVVSVGIDQRGQDTDVEVAGNWNTLEGTWRIGDEAWQIWFERGPAP